MLLGILVGVAALFFLPDPLWAWGPATHVFLGQGVLDSLSLFSPTIRGLLTSYPYDFLYGSVAADISLAKKYVPEGRHCHNWSVGEEIYESAKSERLRAVGLGYLAHLAADTVAHNFFVPRQLLLTSSTKGLGHSYWEHRMDYQIGESYMGLARRVVMNHDHASADALFDQVLSSTLFSFQTNRRIFRGMIRFQDNDRWQTIFGTLLQNSRWTLTQEEIDQYVVRSFDSVVEYLQRRGDAVAAGLDPIGEENLEMSKRIRRMALRDGAWRDGETLTELADDFFPLPDVRFGYWRALQGSLPSGTPLD